MLFLNLHQFFVFAFAFADPADNYFILRLHGFTAVFITCNSNFLL